MTNPIGDTLKFSNPPQKVFLKKFQYPIKQEVKSLNPNNWNVKDLFKVKNNNGMKNSIFTSKLKLEIDELGWNGNKLYQLFVGIRLRH